jgi:hypothetical protein
MHIFTFDGNAERNDPLSRNLVGYDDTALILAIDSFRQKKDLITRADKKAFLSFSRKPPNLPRFSASSRINVPNAGHANVPLNSCQRFVEQPPHSAVQQVAPQRKASSHCLAVPRSHLLRADMTP